MSKVLLLGAQHGDELLGERLYEYLRSNRIELIPHVEYMVGNPEAYKRGVRYIESDLNRSYNGSDETYEERRAAEILTYIQEKGFDLVLDLHTTTCKQPACLIVAAINPLSGRFIRASSYVHIVVMEPEVVRTALDGVCPQAVSIELNKDITDDGLALLCDDIQRYIDNQSSTMAKYIYEVDLLRKVEVDEDEFKLLRNFELSPGGYYPVLVGESSYQKHGYDYIGFKADKRYKFKV